MRNENRVSVADLGASRRDFLKSIAAIGSGVLFTPGEWIAMQNPSTSSSANSGRIDFHSHYVAPGGNPVLAGNRWTADKALEDMDGSGVSTAILSLNPGGLSDPSAVVRVCRESNEYAARLAMDHKGRFGVFAMAPLPNIDAALKEIEYGFDTLKADGIGMYTNYGDKWLGDPVFNPVFEELNRRRAVVFAHPQSANCCRNLIPGVGDGNIEWATDTTRAIWQVTFSGAAARYPNVRMIWSHGGGTMPYLVDKFARAAKAPQAAANFPGGFAAVAAKFYFDTAMVANPAAMAALTKVVPVSQIVFGTDYPFRPFTDYVTGLKDCGAFTARDLQMIYRENALPLLPRFRA